jgi:hypothetical protein
MSLFSTVWICMLTSGVRNSLSPLTGDGETHALLADLAHLAQAPDLEAAAVGEHRPAPALEAVQAAELAQHVQPGRSHRWKVLPRMICGAHVEQRAAASRP